jgi:transcriptional regulator with XRE-family HTH domain
MAADLTRAVVAYLRQLREARGWTAEDLASATRDSHHPMSRGTIAKLECGVKATLTVDELDVLCAALKVTPAMALYMAGEPD